MNPFSMTLAHAVFEIKTPGGDEGESTSLFGFWNECARVATLVTYRVCSSFIPSWRGAPVSSDLPMPIKSNAIHECIIGWG